MAKRLTNPYPCNRVYSGNRIIYHFETDNKVPYQAYFSDYEFMFGTHSLDCQFYTFDLIVLGSQVRPPKNIPTDERIGDTVQHCFSELFQNPKNVVIAVYDSSDGNELARKRKFDSWFNRSEINYIERVDFEMPDEDYNLLASVFFHIDLPIKEEVLNRYQEILERGNVPLN